MAAQQNETYQGRFCLEWAFHFYAGTGASGKMVSPARRLFILVTKSRLPAEAHQEYALSHLGGGNGCPSGTG
jgi:hypothetical protein